MTTSDSARPRKSTRLSGEGRAQLAEKVRGRYEAGASIRSIAAEIERSYGFVQGLLKETGVPLRSRGGAHRSGSKETPTT